MTRAQVNDNFGGQQLVTQAHPITPTGVAGNNGGWQGLANAFAAGDLLAEQAAQLSKQQETDRAVQFANSKSAGELHALVTDGKLLASESPVFAATVQNIWGKNAAAQIDRDVEGKLASGELKFNSPQDLDAHLTEQRNELLQGQSRFAAAGFDHAFQTTRQRLMDGVAKINNQERVQQAQVQATDYLANKLNDVTSTDFKGTPQEAAQYLIHQYQALRDSTVMTDKVGVGALSALLTRATSSGKVPLVEALLGTDVPGKGSLRAVLGETHAQTVLAKVHTENDRVQRERVDTELSPWLDQAREGKLDIQKFESWHGDATNTQYTSTAQRDHVLLVNREAIAHQQRELDSAKLTGAVQASEAEARRRVAAAVEAGDMGAVSGTAVPMVLTPQGASKEFNVREYAERYLVSRSDKLTPDQQIHWWASVGMVNPNWKAVAQAGMFNLDSIRVDATRKPQGELNEAGKKAIALFRLMDSTSPAAARATFGEDAYKRFSNIAFLRQMGMDDSQAAEIAGGYSSGRITPEDFGPVRLEISKAVSDLTQSSFLPNWAVHMLGGNTDTNYTEVHGTVRRLSELLASSGRYSSGKDAVKAAVEYIGHPAVSVNINGTLYERSLIPPAPKGSVDSGEYWFEKFIDAVPKALARTVGIADHEVRLSYSAQSQVFVAMAGGVPLADSNGNIRTYSAADIRSWSDSAHKSAIESAVAKARKAQEKSQEKPERGPSPFGRSRADIFPIP